MPHKSLTATDFVTVFHYGFGKSRAECSCGWEGRIRWTRGIAVLDACKHRLDTGCREGCPLVIRDAYAPMSAQRRPTPWWAWTTAAGGIIGAALYFASAPASAGPVDAAYLDTLDHYSVPYVSDQVAIDLGHTICEAFDTGLSLETVVRTGVDSGFTASQASYLAGAAVGAYCPEYTDLMDPPSSPRSTAAGIGGRI